MHCCGHGLHLIGSYQSCKKIGFATVKSVLDFVATKTFQRLKIKCEITTIFIFYAKRFVYLMQNKLFKLVFVKKPTYFSRCNSILVCYIYLHLGHTLRPKNQCASTYKCNTYLQDNGSFSFFWRPLLHDAQNQSHLPNLYRHSTNSSRQKKRKINFWTLTFLGFFQQFLDFGAL